MTDQEDITLAIVNLAELQEKVKMAGFGDYFKEKIREELLLGQDQFSILRSLQIDKDAMDYKMDIRVDKIKKKAYLNDMHVTLTEESGVQRSQSFPRFLRITAKEAYNLLKWGISSGVEKSLFNRDGVRYRSFVTLDINSEKDLYGSYPLLQYHENYYREPFTVEGALRRLPIPLKELKEDAEPLIASLKRGNMTMVTALMDGKEQGAYLSINAKAGRLELRDAGMKIMELNRKKV